MKNIKLSILTLIAIGNFAYAGGDISPVTIYETDDVERATEAYKRAIPVIEEVVPEYIEPVYVEPVPIEPVVVPVPVVAEPTPRVVVPITPPTPPVTPPPTPTSSSSNGFYTGLGITGVAYESACDCKVGGGSENNLAISGRVGYDFNKYIGLEARGTTTVAGGGGADVEHMGLFVKPMYPIGDATNIYALIGAGKTKTSGDLQKVDAESLALGAGVEYDLSIGGDGQGDDERGVGLYIDYERLVVKSDSPDLDTVTAGVTYDF